MPDRRARRSRQPVLVLLGCAALTAYFATHAIQGRYGFGARQLLLERQGVLQAELGRLEAVRAALARDVGLLSSDPPDPDIVEEAARGLLGYARPGDLVVRAASGR